MVACWNFKNLLFECKFNPYSRGYLLSSMTKPLQ